MLKQVADSDSIYRKRVTNSNQTGVFLGTNETPEVMELLKSLPLYEGDNKPFGILKLTKENLAKNAMAHFGETGWHQRSNGEFWRLDISWMIKVLEKINKAFQNGSEFEFHINIANEHSRQESSAEGAAEGKEEGNVNAKGVNGEEDNTESEGGNGDKKAKNRKRRVYIKVATLENYVSRQEFDLRDVIFSGDYIEISQVAPGKLSLAVYPTLPSGHEEDSQFTGEESCEIELLARQLIVYGAPGTGKSYKVNTALSHSSGAVRTTFHPDSDYSSFVGCHKPTMTRRPYLGQQGIPVKGSSGETVTEEVISYTYVPQAFTLAYVEAWKKFVNPSLDEHARRQFLIIEEINRGNCAQIFGDLFQLLDRDETSDGPYRGSSRYAIDVDTDLKNYLMQAFSDVTGLPEEIKNGQKLSLPPNLYILATMNTSDQSLFPMDSAFKRRWEWEYVPIKDAGKGWKLLADNAEFDWWKFLTVINAKIYEATKSEDKKLGYFFVTADKDEIVSARTFVCKVLFYLYNDVFRDYDLPAGFVASTGEALSFQDFFLEAGAVNEVAVRLLLEALLSDSSTDA